LLSCLAWPLSALKKRSLFNSIPGNLPKDIVPRHYSIEVRPDVSAMKTIGTETITLEVQRATNQIVLNAVGTKIKHASLKGVSGEEQILSVPKR